MPKDTLGTAWVDIKAKFATLSNDVAKGLGDAGAKGSKAAEAATKQTGAKIGAQVADGVKKSKVDAALEGLVVKGGKIAEAKGPGIGSRLGSRIKAGFNSAHVDNTIADDVRKGAKRGEDEAGKSAKRIGGRFHEGFREGGKGFKAMSEVFLANSGGALEPLQKIYEQVQGLGPAFSNQSKSIGASMTKIGAAITGVGIVGSSLGGRDVKALAQFKAAVEATGKPWEENKKKAEEAAHAAEKYGYTLPEVVDTLNRLTVATHDPEKAFALLNTIMGASAVSHQSLARVAIAFSRAANGNTMGLRRYGLQVASSTVATKAAEAANKAHQKAVEGSAAATQKYHEMLARLAVSQKGTKASTLDLAKAQYAVAVAQAGVAKATDTSKAGSLTAIKNALALQKAQEAVGAAVRKHGSASVAASDAQAKLAIVQQTISAKGNSNTLAAVGARLKLQAAEERLSVVQGKGVDKTKLTIGQQQQLKHAYDDVFKARKAAVETGVTAKAADTRKETAGDSVAQIVAQGNKVFAGQNAAAVAGFNGKLKVLGAMIENRAAEYGAKFGKTLTVAGPALLGIGALIQTGIIGTTGRAIGSVGKFGFSLLKVSTYGKGITKITEAYGKVSDVALKAAANIGVAAENTAKAARRVGSVAADAGRAVATGFRTAGRWIGDTSALVKNRIASVASSAASRIAAASQAAWGAVKRFFITTTNAETGVQRRSTLAVIAHAAWTKIVAAATKVWTGIQLAFNIVMSANPIILVGVAIVALVGFVIYAYTHFKTFHKIVDSVARFFRTVFINSLRAVRAAWAGVTAFFSGVWDGIKAAFHAGVAVVRGAVSGVIGFVKAHWPLLLGILTGPIGLAVGLIVQHWDAIKAGARNAFAAVKNLITGAFTKIKDAVVNGVATIASFFTGLPGKILGAIGNVDTMLLDAGARIIGGLAKGIANAAKNALKNAVGGAVGIIKGHFPFSPAKMGPLSGAGDPFLMGSKVGSMIAAGIASKVGHVAAAVKKIAASVPGSLRPGEIARAVAGDPTIPELRRASARATQRVAAYLPTYNRIHEEDTVARRRVQHIKDEITLVRQNKALGVGAPQPGGGTSTGPNPATVAKARQRLADAIAAQGPASLDADRARAALAKAQAGGSSKPGKVDPAAAKAHNAEITKQIIALQRQEAQAKKTQAADDARLKSAKTHLNALKAAQKAAADAYHAAQIQQATDIAAGVRTASTANTGISSIFNYHPGYGATSAKGAAAVLRSYIAQNRTFGGLLHLLAKAGLNVDMLQQLIGMGAQAGTAIARQLLADPTAIVTFNDLEKDLNSAITATSTDLATTILTPPPGKKKAPPPAKGSKVGKAAAAAGVEGFSPVPAMVVQGDFNVYDVTQLDRLSQMLATEKRKTTRATGGTRR